MSETVFNGSGAVEPAAQYHPLVEQSVPLTPPGAQLAARREQLNLTVEHVANQLNLAPRQIQALEADNYGALPGMASVRGFIRAYAKLLKMDAEPLVQAVANEVSATSVEPLGPALSTTPFSDGRSSLAARRIPLGWMIAIALAAALLVLAIVAHRMGWLPDLSQSISLRIDGRMPASASSEPDSAVAAASAESEEKASAPGRVVVSELPAAVAPQTRPAAAPVARTDPAPAKAEPQPAQTAAVKIDPQPAPAPAAAPAVATAAPATVKTEPAAAVAAAKAPDAADPAAKDMLVLKLRQDSWIDIRRSNNSPVVSRLARAGETETVKVSGPLALTIGNAAGVEVLLRGKAVPLETETNSNVAHLNLR